MEVVVAFADTAKLKLSQFFASAEHKHFKRKPAARASAKIKKKT